MTTSFLLIMQLSFELLYVMEVGGNAVASFCLEGSKCCVLRCFLPLSRKGEFLSSSVLLIRVPLAQYGEVIPTRLEVSNAGVRACFVRVPSMNVGEFRHTIAPLEQ